MFRLVLLGYLFFTQVVTLGAADSSNPRQPSLDLVSRAEQKSKQLAGKLESCRAAGQNIALPEAALAVAELFCRYSRHDGNRASLHEPALRSRTCVEQMLDAELRRADEVLARRAKYPAPRWMINANPGLARRGYGNGVDYVIEHPQAVAVREKLLDHYVPMAGAEPSLFAADLANGLAFQGPTELMFENWPAWRERKYGNVESLNRQNHASIDVATMPSSRQSAVRQ